MSIWNTLTPSQVVESVRELSPESLKAKGIEAVITDLDNTLVPWRHYEIMPGVVEWLAALEVAGIKICIASNTIHTERLKQLAETMNIPFVDRVQKPRTGGFLRAMKLMRSGRSNTAVFGDQIFTDVLAGNRLGLHTILLRPPLSKEEFVSTQLVRYVENGVIRKLRESRKVACRRRCGSGAGSYPRPAHSAGPPPLYAGDLSAGRAGRVAGAAGATREVAELPSLLRSFFASQGPP